MSADYMEALRAQLALLAEIRRRDLLSAETAALTVALETASPIFMANWVELACMDASVVLPPSTPWFPELLPCPAGFLLLQGAIAPVSDEEIRLCGITWLEAPPSEDGSRRVYMWFLYADSPRRLVQGMVAGVVADFIDDPPHPAYRQRGLDAALHGRRELGIAVDDITALAERLLLYAIWAFMAERRITTVSRRGVDRQTRKHAANARWLPEPVIQVIELRAAESHQRSYDGDHEAIEWSCRWVSRGHWRRQPYPSEGIVRTRWIPASIKGPADKPLRHATKLLAVVR